MRKCHVKSGWWLSLFCSFWFSTGLQARDVIIETPAGGVNWTQGTIFAHGYGTARQDLSSAQQRLMSRRAALVDGQRNLLEMTKGVRIDSTRKVSDLVGKSDRILSQVHGIIRGARPIKEHYQNQIYTITLAMPISGDLLKVVWAATPQSVGFSLPLLPLVSDWISNLSLSIFPAAVADEVLMIENNAQAESARQIIEWLKAKQPGVIRQELEQALIRFESQAQFSGLLIDASRVRDFDLATVPTIRDTDGTIIYPNPETSYDDIIDKRGVSYDFDLDDAVRNRRVAVNPFIVNAISTYKLLTSDLVISLDDARRIQESASTRTAMNKAGVLIVVGI